MYVILDPGSRDKWITRAHQPVRTDYLTNYRIVRYPISKKVCFETMSPSIVRSYTHKIPPTGDEQGQKIDVLTRISRSP